MWSIAALSAEERLTLLCIAQHADDGGTAVFWGVGDLAKETCSPPENLKTILRTLHSNGRITFKRLLDSKISITLHLGTLRVLPSSAPKFTQHEEGDRRVAYQSPESGRRVGRSNSEPPSRYKASAAPSGYGE